MAQLKHVEVWDKSALAAGAQRVAILTEIVSASIARKVGSEERAIVRVPLTARKYASLLPGRWLRFEFSDGTWSEWRVKEIADASDPEGAATLTCGGYGSALAKCPLIGLTDADGATSYRFDGVALTPAQHLSSYILPAASAGGLSFVVAGTLDATGLVDVTYDGDNPWTALNKLAEATGKELELERVSGEVRVHLRTKVGSGTTGATLRVGDNAVVQRTRSELEQQTRIVGLAQDGITIAEAVWKATAVSGTTITLADPAGGDGPLLRNDQLNGLYLEAANRTRRERINSSNASAQQVQVGATNSALHSEDLTNAVYTKDNTTVTANATAAPTGAVTADRVRETATTTVHGVYQSVAHANGDRLALSCYVKPDGRTRISFYAGGSGGDIFGAVFDLVSAGSKVGNLLSGNGSLLEATITAEANGFYRVSVVGVRGTQTSTTLVLALHQDTSTPTTFAPTYLGDTTKGVFPWGCQVEVGASVLGVYVPTTTAAASSATGVFAVGDLVRVRTTAGGGKLTYLDDPAQVAAFGVLSGEPLRRDDLPETCNLLPNPTQAAWAGASSDPADLWAKVGTPTVTRTTAAQYVETGGKSARVQSTADGQGYATPLVSLGLSALRPYVSGLVTFYLASGRVRVELVATNGTQTWVVPDGFTPERKAVSSQLGTFVTIGVGGINLHALGATSVRLRVVQEGSGTADFYVDRAQITESAGQLPFVDGSGPTKLWQAVNQRLALVAPTRVRYEVSAFDFYRLDGTRYPYRQFKLGAQHTLHDPVLGVVDGVRVLELEEDLLVESQTSLTLSNLPEDLASLFEPDPASRLAGNVTAAPVQAAVRTVVDASTSNPNRVISSSAGFTSADVGKTIWVLGGAAGNAILKAVITSLVSSSQVAMSVNIGAFVSGATAIIGDAAEVATIAASIGGTRAGAALLNENGTLADGVKDVNGRDAKRFFGKVSESDPDTADTIGQQPGTTYIPQIPLLTISVTQTAVDSDSVDVTVDASDPTGGAAPTIGYTSGGSVTSLGGGSYRLARPASGSGPLHILFDATKTGRQTAYAGITIPEQVAAGGSVPPSIDAFYEDGFSNSGNTITLKWTVSNAPGGATYTLRRAVDHPDDTNDNGFVTVSTSASSPFTDSPPLDLLPKGSSGAILTRVDYELRMIESGVVLATRTCFVNVYADYVA